MNRTPRKAAQRGQTLVVTALFIAVVFAAGFLTFSVGYRIREKVKLQAMADSSAYSLAVAQSRAFNFYAVSNRAIIAQYVSILSIHSHQSYLSWHEGLLDKVAFDYDVMAGMLVGACACSKIPNCPCKPCTTVCGAIGVAQEIATEIRSANPGGAQWFHEKWHASPVYDERMAMASQEHYQGVARLRGQQLAVERELKGLMSSQTLARELARGVDQDFDAPGSPGAINLRYYQRAVTSDTIDPDDYHEILAGTRWPGFLTARGFVPGTYWAKLMTDAQQRAQANGGDSTSAYAVNEGNSKTLGKDPGSDGGQLSAFIHTGGHDQAGFGGGTGAGAEDHGYVFTGYSPAACPCGAFAFSTLNQGEFGVWSDPKEHGHASHHWYQSGTAVEARHDLGGCTNRRGKRVCGIYQGYMRYLLTRRYKDDLWHMPRTFAVLTNKVPDKRRPWDFDFTMEVPQPVSLTTQRSEGDVQSKNTMAAMAGGLAYYHKIPRYWDETAACDGPCVAVGWQRVDGGEGWKEPPNLWNPFWRAKLHPIWKPDASSAQGLQAAHSPSNSVISALGWDAAINY